MLQIDGSEGEGGGQIVRSSLALSIITGQPVAIDNIRARRKNTGLQRQHLTAVLAAGQICGAGMLGASLGSSRLQFAPGPIRAGNYEFDIGTAGSASLVMQTILLPLMLAEQESTVSLTGGTHNPLAPPYEFFALAYLPLVKQIGLHAQVQLQQRGFYPVGGGQMRLNVSPSGALSDFSLLERGAKKRYAAEVVTARLPENVGQREASKLQTQLGWKKDDVRIVEDRTSRGPGNVVLVTLEFEHVTEVIVSFGARGKRAEQVALEAAEETQTYLDATAPVGTHLADQLLLPLGVAAWRGQRSEFRTLPLTQHSLTHIDILQRFLPIHVTTREDDSGVVVSVEPQAALG